jgi:hypothetical protein
MESKPDPDRDRKILEQKMLAYGRARGWPPDLFGWNLDQLREARHAVQHGLDLPSTEGI